MVEHTGHRQEISIAAGSNYRSADQSTHETAIEMGLVYEFPALEVSRGELPERAVGTATRHLRAGVLLSRALEWRGDDILVRSMDFEIRGEGVVARSTILLAAAGGLPGDRPRLRVGKFGMVARLSIGRSGEDG